MADLIERDAAISKFIEGDGDDEFTNGYNFAVDEYRKKISDIPAVNRWIPVEDALPDSKEDVLVWFEYFRYGEYNCMYQTYNIGNYFAKYDSWMVGHETGWQKLKVLAWMPLPEPPESEVK